MSISSRRHHRHRLSSQRPIIVRIQLLRGRISKLGGDDPITHAAGQDKSGGSIPETKGKGSS
ncbi:hypothetical protein V8F44DRAFT_604636 [Aspergillus fumigatus]